jgi:hypothetical protein
LVGDIAVGWRIVFLHDHQAIPQTVLLFWKTSVLAVMLGKTNSVGHHLSSNA